MAMEHAGPKRHRCSECRSWFKPAPPAAAQKVCGAQCRRKRRRRLARRRRALAVQDYRVDERQRQRLHRQRRRAAGGSPLGTRGPCHAPPSPGNIVELAAKVLESWDRAAALSRATLRRKIPKILRGLALDPETKQAQAGTLSRATLEP
jgi:hypothetical protein